MTPGAYWKACSIPQKQPPAKYATALLPESLTLISYPFLFAVLRPALEVVMIAFSAWTPDFANRPPIDARTEMYYKINISFIILI